MNPQPTITLRDVALRLARLRQGTSEIADGRLLSLLKTGELKAGFEFPESSWIAISPPFWTTVSSDKFSSIRKSSNDKKRTGIFRVRLSDVAHDLVEHLSQHLQSQDQPVDKAIWKELERTLTAASRQYEVLVAEREWAGYLRNHNLVEPSSNTKGKGGRHPKEGWRQMCVLVGAYIVAHQRTTKEKMKIGEAALALHELGKAEDIPGLPAADTIKAALSEIFSKSATLFAK